MQFLTKALLKLPLAKLARQNPVVNQTIYVDDFGQQASGNIFDVAYVLAIAAVCFVLVAARLSLHFRIKACC